jgi:hypothetical protein
MTDMLKDVIIPILSVVASIIVAYFTAIYAMRREETHGKARLLEICRRYILNFINAFDRERGTLRTDPLAFKLYIEELREIVDDLGELLSNAYVEKLILEYPRVTKLLVNAGS